MHLGHTLEHVPNMVHDLGKPPVKVEGPGEVRVSEDDYSPSKTTMQSSYDLVSYRPSCIHCVHPIESCLNMNPSPTMTHINFKHLYTWSSHLGLARTVK